MSTFFECPDSGNFIEPLVKAVKAKRKNLGDWGGLPVIGIGIRGGKIVGCKSDGKPIYAGSSAAKLLISKKRAVKTSEKAIVDWLVALNIPAKGRGDGHIIVSAQAGELLQEQFGDLKKQVKSGKTWVISVKSLEKHVGSPLAPKKADERVTMAARAASGELENDPFPPLQSLKQIPAGKLEGSHDNWVFEDPTGKKFVFKKGNLTISRAEEAACRIGRLVLGPGKVPAAKHITFKGVEGVLLEYIPGAVFNDVQHSHPSTDILQKNFKEVCQHHVLDWLVSNHDGHAGNYLENEQGMAAFDKGQAWKFFPNDKLTKDYSPNYSKPIYVKFWNKVKQGTITGDPLQPIGQAIAQVQKISDEQFKAIVTPYAMAKTDKDDENHPAVVKRVNAMLERMHSVKKDFEGFLSDLYAKPVTIPVPGQDNFETMPEAMTEPGKPKVLDKPKTPVEEGEHVAGWPQTKGKITIHNPGSPPEPGVAWPKGYPGPGFKAVVNYNGGDHTIEFTQVGNKGAFTVFFPDGESAMFESPNKASDSLVLKKKGLDITMPATEKKKAENQLSR
jgi:hypothetical protein